MTPQPQNSSVTYSWMESDKRFDCVVGISVKNTPVSTGVFISTRTVLTSANPFQEYINKNSAKEIKIHTVSNRFNESETRKAEKLAGNQSFRNQHWVTIGFDKLHTTIHDLLLINIASIDAIEKKQSQTGDIRKPFPVNLPYANRTFLPDLGGAVFAGFGYIDERHISENTELEVAYYLGETFADCDEWIPREWGRFICLLNEENLAGVASGAPLFHSTDTTIVIGIGCFEVTKGDESVLVFTDLRPYVDYLYGYLEDVDDDDDEQAG